MSFFCSRQRLFSTLLLAVSVVPACVRPEAMVPVEPIQVQEFETMTGLLRPKLQQKGLLDAEGAWYSPLISFAQMGIGEASNAGEVLLNRLSPAFRFPTLDPEQLPRTFKAMLVQNAQVTLKPSEFTVHQGLDTVYVALLALTDWNRDGKTDWVVLCRITPDLAPQARRDYYVVITDFDSPVLKPEVIAVHDCRDAICRPVGNDGISPIPGLIQDSPVVELLQGQEAVVQAPGKEVPNQPRKPLTTEEKRAQEKQLQDQLQEEALKN